MTTRGMGAGAVGLAWLLCLALAAPAAATTFCVPDFHAACPMGGGNVAEPDLEVAMETDDNDGIDDTIIIGAGTLIDTNTFTSGTGDALAIIGAGQGQTIITSSLVGGNNYVLNVQREGTMTDLTVRVPDSFADDAGAGLQTEASVSDVDVESRNDASDGVTLVSGADFNGGRIYGASGGAIDTGFKTAGSGPASSDVIGAQIEGAAWGVSADNAAIPVFVRRSGIVDAAPYGVHLGNGGIVNVYNTVIESSGGQALSATEFGSDGPALFTARGVTMVKTGGPPAAAVNAFLGPAATGSIFIYVHDSIIRGFESSYDREAPTDPGLGNADITLRYSNLAPVGSSSGDGTVILGPANINADPMFTSATDFRLLAGSPSIDSADPTPSVALLDDFDGLSRPFDGDADGDARRDMGAFEYRPAPDPPANPQTPTKKKKCKKKKRKKKNRAGASAKKKKKCKRKKRKKKG